MYVHLCDTDHLSKSNEERWDQIFIKFLLTQKMYLNIEIKTFYEVFFFCVCMYTYIEFV